MVSNELKKGFGKRMEMLVHLLIQKGYARNKTEVGRIIGVTTSSISQMISGERMLTLPQMSTLRDKTRFNANWYLTGIGPFFLDVEEEEDSIMIVTRAMNAGKLTIEEGEKIISDLTHSRNQVTERDKEIIELSSEVIELQRLIKTT